MRNSKIRSMIREKAYVSATHNAVRIIVIDGDQIMVFGRLGGWFTKGGTPIRHPSAYSKCGWSNMEYRRLTKRILVGRDYLKSLGICPAVVNV